MLSWSTKRRIIYGGSVLLLAIIIAVTLFYKVVYRSPTCFDNIQNGSETGVDCGGSCELLCKNDSMPPVVLWAKTFNISNDLYTAVAYVENPNQLSKNPKADYEFYIYDAQNSLIESRHGSISIPRNKKFAVYELGFTFKNRKPKYTEFKFTNFSTWVRDVSPEPDINIDYSTLISTSTMPRIEGTVSNKSTQDLSTVELDAFVLDNNENVVATSQTFVDNLLKRTSQQFVFTWPKPFDFGTESCSNTLDVAMVLDKSGSMMSEAKDPPEPFSTVKSTAQNFIKNLSDNDQASVVSFGTNAQENSVLSLNKKNATDAIDGMFLSTSTLEQTNITDGLSFAKAELESQRSRAESKKVIILLTDGVPTEPKMKDQPDYPSISALGVARDIASSSITLYTIGLGKDVSAGFLKNLAQDDSRYFFAPSKESLNGIYNKISSALCQKKPNVINVIYRQP